MKNLLHIYNLLQKKEKKSLWILIVVQFLLSVFEILAIVLVGLAGALLATRLTGQKVPNFVSWFELSNESLFFVSYLIIGLSSILLIFKTVFSIFINKKVNSLLASVTADLSRQTIYSLGKCEYSWFKKFDVAQVNYHLGQGINQDLKSILLGYFLIVSETILITLVFLFLSFVSWLLTLILLVFFCLFGLIIFRLTTSRMERLSRLDIRNVTENNLLVSNLLGSFKELYISRKMEVFGEFMSNKRLLENQTRATLQWLEQIPKFGLELLVILVGLVLLAGASLPSNFMWASSTILIYSIALTRLTPSILRIQAGVSLVRFGLARFQSTDNFLEQIGHNQVIQGKPLETVKSSFGPPKVEVNDLHHSFNDGADLFNGLSFHTGPGSILLIYGPSGAGKSTLLELLMGLTTPNAGTIEIDGLNPREWHGNLSNNISYLPQEVSLMSGSILQNVTLKHDVSNVSEEEVLDILRLVGLGYLTERSGTDLGSQIGTEVFLSGGERQRLGFARAVYFRASLLVLDEPTSALDPKVEDEIFQLIESLGQSRTILMVSHSKKALEKFKNSILI